jgi:hypothetical protein
MKLHLDKVKRPAGVFQFDVERVEDAGAGMWLWCATDSAWRAPHDEGVMPFDALMLVDIDRPCVTWWVDDPSDPRIEIDICLAPLRTPTGWSFVDLELDPVRRELTGLVEVEDWDEFEECRQRGLIDDASAELAVANAESLRQALVERREPWGQVGWDRLRLLQQGSLATPQQ